MSAVRHVWRVVMIFFVLLVVEYLVLPQVAGARKSVHLLSQVNVLYLLIGVLLEVASLASYAELTRAVLPPRDRPARPSPTSPSRCR